MIRGRLATFISTTVVQKPEVEVTLVSPLANGSYTCYTVMSFFPF